MSFFSAVWATVWSFIWPDLTQLTTPQLIKRLSSHFSLSKINALRELHRRLTVAEGDENVVAAGDATLIPVLVRLLSSSCRWTAIEAAKCLAAIAAAEADVVIEHAAAVAALLQQLSSPHLDVRVYVASALCSIVCSRNGLMNGVSESLLAVIAVGLDSGDAAIQQEAATAVHTLLCTTFEPPIQEAIDAGVIQPLVAVLGDSSRPKVQYEAAWALTNIASGTSEQTKAVVDAGAVPPLVQLLSSPDDDVRHQALWALGNIAGDGPNAIAGDASSSCDLVLEAGVMEPLVKVLRHESENVSMMRTATWALSNLSQKPPRPFELVSKVVSVVAELIRTPEQDAEVLRRGCRVLSHFTNGAGDEGIEVILDSGVCGRLVELMGHHSNEIQVPALRAVGNIAAGNAVQTQAVIECGAIPALKALLSSPRQNICREACWAISNIMAGSGEQRQAVIDGDVVPQLITMATTDEPSVKREALWAVINGMRQGSQQQMDQESSLRHPALLSVVIAVQVEYLVSCGCVGPLCDLLDDNTEVAILTRVLKAIQNLLMYPSCHDTTTHLCHEQQVCCGSVQCGSPGADARRPRTEPLPQSHTTG